MLKVTFIFDNQRKEKEIVGVSYWGMVDANGKPYQGYVGATNVRFNETMQDVYVALMRCELLTYETRSERGETFETFVEQDPKLIVGDKIADVYRRYSGDS